MHAKFSPGDFSELRVLLVDDNAFFRKLERSMLRQLGVAKITEASDGLEALERVLNRDCDIILLDWKMPEFSGSEFLISLREKDDPYFRSIPVIVVTGFAKKSLVLKAVELGASGVIVKPFSISLLKQRIEATGIFRNGDPLRDTLPPMPRGGDAGSDIFDLDGVL